MPASAPSAMPIRPILAWAKTAHDNLSEPSSFERLNEDTRQSGRSHHGTTRGLEVTVTTEVGPQRFGQSDPAV
jgi:hypothetical protein